MSLASVINERKGRAGAWRVLPSEQFPGAFELYHYTTRMLVWDDLPDGTSELIDWEIGWGSKSDQDGLNRAFKVLNVRWYYSRRGGASIDPIDSEENVYA